MCFRGILESNHTRANNNQTQVWFYKTSSYDVVVLLCQIPEPCFHGDDAYGLYVSIWRVYGVQNKQLCILHAPVISIENDTTRIGTNTEKRLQIQVQ